MSNLENKIFNDIKNPLIYVHYVIDILILTDDIQKLKNYNQHSKITVLKFTYELNTNNKIPFLDVLIDANNDNFNTSVYKKNILVIIHVF